MPHANIWIRKSNQAAWDSLDDKSGFINACLKDLLLDNRQQTPLVQTPVQVEVRREYDSDLVFSQLEDMGLHVIDGRPGYASTDLGDVVRYTVFNDKVTIVK